MDTRQIITSREFKIFISFFVLFLFFSQWIGWDDDSRMGLTMAMVDRGTLQIDGYHNGTSDRSFYNGHYYSDKAPGLSIMAVPSYAAWRLLTLPFYYPPQGVEYQAVPVGNTFIYEAVNPGSFHLLAMVIAIAFTSSLISALSVIIIYRFSAHFTRKEEYRMLAVLAYGLGTMVLYYSTVFLGHGPAVALALFSFYLLFKAKHRRVTDRMYIIIAGLAIGFSAVVEYSHMIILLFLAVYLLSFRKRAVPIFLLSCLIGISPLLMYNAAISGNPFELTYFHLDPEIWGETLSSVELSQGISIEPGPAFMLWIFGGQFSPGSIGYHLNIMLRLTFGLYRGLFIYSPILLLGLYCMRYSRKEYRAETWMAALLLISFLWLASTPGFEWWGGAFFGPRHLLAIVPFLFFPLMAYIEKLDRRVLAAFLVVSVLISFSGMQHTEDIYGEGSLGMSEIHESMMLSSLAPLGNPIASHYMPLTLSNGPRGRIFEGLANGMVPDIRVFRSMGGMPYSGFALLPLLAIIWLLWRRELVPVIGNVKKLLTNLKA